MLSGVELFIPGPDKGRNSEDTRFARATISLPRTRTGFSNSSDALTAQ